MPTCHTKPKDSRALVQAVGRQLVSKRGKRSYYALPDIRDAVTSSGFPVDITCWAYAVFASPQDFKSHHDALGEACDYFAMRAEIMPDLASKSTFSWPDVDLSWLEWPDFDWPDFFSGFDNIDISGWFDGI